MKTLVIVAHPDLARSRVNACWKQALSRQSGFKVKDLSELYPDYAFDIVREQADLVEADRIILQFPLFWYSCPAILKKWIDDVFTPGFAYARGGDKLKGKELMLCISVGAPEDGYRATGFNNFTLDELLRPFQQTACYVQARLVTPFVFYQSVFATGEQLEQSVKDMLAHVTNVCEPPSVVYEKLLLDAEAMNIALIS
ncbi:NAD(P)H-dependent oxidoreductase [Pseudomonas sp. D(2018)]|uniref:NAD(P)H-dependent oxidoreductase n=1 Tax=Pseudomonas sp. D(2018) TaxID=2502238 RepID=UPI0010F70D14|nr:NAD(P)H-dependent oxidoreductase [Pseudomonas sp. D(2018)]